MKKKDIQITTFNIMHYNHLKRNHEVVFTKIKYAKLLGMIRNEKKHPLYIPVSFVVISYLWALFIGCTLWEFDNSVFFKNNIYTMMFKQIDKLK